MPDQLQRLLGLVGSIISLPLVAILAVAVRLDSPGPAVHRAIRIGREGTPFVCYKLRTMRLHDGTGPAVTAEGDPRISRFGRVLRRFRLDELPQLWNVARGEMRLVGPRPEAPAFVDAGSPLHRRVLSAAPGITGLTQLAYVDEAMMLAVEDPEQHYRDVILPAKLRLDAVYLDHRSFAIDLWILQKTLQAIAGRGLSSADIERRIGTPLDPSANAQTRERNR